MGRMLLSGSLAFRGVFVNVSHLVPSSGPLADEQGHLILWYAKHVAA